MKKTTFYTLLCTTIILPGTLLAAEQQDKPGTPLPVKAAKLHKAVDDNAQGTPKLQVEAKKKYANHVLSPDTKLDYEARELAERRKERDAKKVKDHEAVDIKLVQETLAQALEEEQTKRANEKVEQEALILKSQEAALQNEALDKRISELTTQIESLTLRITSKTESQKLSREQIEALSLELKTKTEELAAAQQEVRERKAREQLLAEQVITEREGKERMQGELKARAEKMDAGNAGGGVQGVAQGGGGHPPVVVNNGAQGQGAPVIVPQQQKKKALPNANFGGVEGDGKL